MFKTDLWDYIGQREHVWGLNIGAILLCSVGFFHMVEQQCENQSTIPSKYAFTSQP